MTYARLKELLTNTGLFTAAEVRKIVRTCGKYTIGNAIVACELSGIELGGHDIDVIIAEQEEN